MFHYFLPAITKEQIAPGDVLDRDLLRTVGLDETLADVSKVPAHASVMDVRKGPTGTSGVVIAPVRKYTGVPDCFYSPTLQTWKSIRVGTWIGWLNGEKPDPKSLERWDIIGGADVKDRLGHAWSMPIGRSPHFGHPYGTLPQAYTFDHNGEVVEHLVPAHTWLWELAGEIRQWYIDSIGPPEDATPAEKAAHVKPPYAFLIKAAGRLLGVNYRLGLAEIGILHELGHDLLTQETVAGICQAAYGWEILAEAHQAAKKKPTENDTKAVPNLPPSRTGDEIPSDAPGTGPAAER
jgi:hypothetical protein